jgi:hypothetical protein
MFGMTKANFYHSRYDLYYNCPGFCKSNNEKAEVKITKNERGKMKWKVLWEKIRVENNMVLSHDTRDTVHNFKAFFPKFFYFYNFFDECTVYIYIYLI